jgi:hypothetical protein
VTNCTRSVTRGFLFGYDGRMVEIGRLREAMVASVVEREGHASRERRAAAFAAPAGPLLEKVARHAYRVTDEDIAAARANGWTEDEIFELVLCAAVGQATRQIESALAALAAVEE